MGICILFTKIIQKKCLVKRTVFKNPSSYTRIKSENTDMKRGMKPEPKQVAHWQNFRPETFFPESGNFL